MEFYPQHVLKFNYNSDVYTLVILQFNYNSDVQTLVILPTFEISV